MHEQIDDNPKDLHPKVQVWKIWTTKMDYYFQSQNATCLL